MKLDEIRGGVRELLHMERYVDEGARTYSRLAASTEASSRYQPRNPERSLELITVLAPRNEVTIVQADPSPSVLDRYLGAQQVLFPVHPETWRSPDVEHLEALRTLPQGSVGP